MIPTRYDTDGTKGEELGGSMHTSSPSDRYSGTIIGGNDESYNQGEIDEVKQQPVNPPDAMPVAEKGDIAEAIPDTTDKATSARPNSDSAVPDKT